MELRKLRCETVTHTVYLECGEEKTIRLTMSCIEEPKYPGRITVKVYAENQLGEPIEGAAILIEGKKMKKFMIFTIKTSEDGTVVFELDLNKKISEKTQVSFCNKDQKLFYYLLSFHEKCLH